MQIPAWMQENVSIAPYTSMQVGGPVRFLVKIESTERLVQALAFAEERKLKSLILGGGSNLVIADDGFAGVVMHMQTKGIQNEDTGEDVLVLVHAGEVMDDVCAAACRSGLSGIECLSGIPGLAGAGPIQNIGAYGQELADVIDWVEVWDREDRACITLARDACRFSYRDSLFKQSQRYVVLRFQLRLCRKNRGCLSYRDVKRYFDDQKNESPTPVQVRNAVLTIRRQKSMVLDVTDPYSRGCGSFFTNPIVETQIADQVDSNHSDQMPRYLQKDGRVKLSAAWLIEHAGFPRGTEFGNVGLSPKHALAIINYGSAKTVDVLNAAAKIRNGVHQHFGIVLEPEPVLVGCRLPD